MQEKLMYIFLRQSGDLHKELRARNRGFFFSTTLNQDPFMNTSLRNFIDMKTYGNFLMYAGYNAVQRKESFSSF